MVVRSRYWRSSIHSLRILHPLLLSLLLCPLAFLISCKATPKPEQTQANSSASSENVAAESNYLNMDSLILKYRSNRWSEVPEVLANIFAQQTAAAGSIADKLEEPPAEVTTPTSATEKSKTSAEPTPKDTLVARSSDAAPGATVAKAAGAEKEAEKDLEVALAEMIAAGEKVQAGSAKAASGKTQDASNPEAVASDKTTAPEQLVGDLPVGEQFPETPEGSVEGSPEQIEGTVVAANEGEADARAQLGKSPAAGSAGTGRISMGEISLLLLLLCGFALVIWVRRGVDGKRR